MIWATILMAIREIRRNTMRSILTTLGIVIGVGSVIAMVTLGRGATAKITADIASMGTNLLIVSPGAERRGPTSGAASPLKLDDAKAIEREVAAVSKVAPSSGRGALLVYGNKNYNTVITGTTNEYFTVRGFTVALGGTFSDAQMQGGTPVCILGATVRKELFGPQDPIGATVRVGSVPCIVIGVLASKGQSTFGTDQDDFVIMPLGAYHRRIAGNTDVSTIFVSAVSDQATTKAKQQIELLMRERRRLAPAQQNDFSVQDMKEISQTLGNVTGALTALLGAIAGVSLLVGGIGIMNIMLVSVTERTREIGLRLAIGARGSEVLLQFLIEAITLSTLGGALGVLFGLGISFGATRALKLPFTIVPDIVLIAFAFSATVGVAFGFLPARKASRLNPIAALRHE
ncbi:MAG: ABC transporter permease [Polyangiales bacterium]